MRGRRRRRRRIEEEAERMQMRNRRRSRLLLSPRMAVTALIKALTAEWAYTTHTCTHVIADEQRWQRAARFGENIGYRMKGGAP